MNSPKMQNFFNESKDEEKSKKISIHEAKDDKGGRNFKEEYVEYKKLQEKLNFLESKIMHIKSNIDTTYQKESKANESLKTS